MRRTLLIIAIVIVIIGIGVGYFYFSNRSANVVVVPAGSVTLPKANQTTAGTAPTATNPSKTAVVAVSARLVKISAGPVVPGMAVVDIPAKDASSTPEIAISFIERQSGNVFSYRKSAGSITRTSNKTIPGIQSAAWLPDASMAFVRYLSGSDSATINTYALPANDSSGFFLSQNLADIAVSSSSPVRNRISNGANVLTLASGVNGSVASLSGIDGSGSRVVFTTPLSALRVSFAGKNQYLAFTKPSAALPGDAFLVDSAGRFSRVAGPAHGLVALASPTGKFVLVSSTNNTELSMALVNTATGESTPLPVATIADKCVWAADESTIYCGIPVDPPTNYSYPDDWYQGAGAFSDRIWKIDVAGRFAQLVLDFSAEASVPLDAQALAVNPAQTTLVFVNKNDSSLWAYSL